MYIREVNPMIENRDAWNGSVNDNINSSGNETTERAESMYIENKIERETSQLGDVSLIIHSGKMSISHHAWRRKLRTRIVHANEFRPNGMNNLQPELKRAKITVNITKMKFITIMTLQNAVIRCSLTERAMSTRWNYITWNY